MSSQASRSALEGLPKQFVASMRTLFDLMDEQKTGQVRLAEIEARWREEEQGQDEDTNCKKGKMPKGVVECLKKVTPNNGLLTFDRFCAGLKICLLRNKQAEEASHGKPPLPNGQTTAKSAGQGAGQLIGSVHPVKAVPSQSVLPTVTTKLSSLAGGGCDMHHGEPQPQPRPAPDFQPSRPPNAPMTATVRPNVTLQQRALSMPLLEHQSPPGGEKTRSRIRTELRGYRSESRIAAPPADAGPELPATEAPRSRRGIMTVLHNWHMGMLNDPERNRGPKEQRAGAPEGGVARARKAGDDFGNSGVISDGDVNSARSKESSHLARKGNARRREPRRHTLASGIDYNMLKRMKQLEQEKDILLQGLEAIDKARSWYLKQIIGVQDKMKFMGQNNGSLEYSTEAHQERLNFQMAQIFEVNQHLGALVESTERGFPLHMNLAIRQPPQMFKLKPQPQAGHEAVALNHLKEINHLLSEEVSKKSERITQLEREKAALVRELFQARSIPRRESDDTTLM